MPGLRSLRNRLALIFALIIVGAIGTIYLSVTPRLEAIADVAAARSCASPTRRQYTPERRRACLPRRPLPRRTTPSVDEAKIKRRPRPARSAPSPRASSTEILVMSVGEAARSCYTDSTPDGGATAPRRAGRDARRRCDTQRLRQRDRRRPANGRQALAAQPDQRRRAAEARAHVRRGVRRLAGRRRRTTSR